MRRIHIRPAVPLIGLTALVVVGLLGCGRPDSAPPSSGALPEPAVTTAAAATDGEPSAPPSRPTIDPCSLVSRSEAERLAGTRLEDTVPVRETCTYTGPVTGPTAQVEVFVGDGAKKFLDIERELGHELRPLAGVGDEAYVSFEAVWVNKSGQWVSIRLVRLNDPAENRKPLEDLARTVATRF
ncbi:hypothetical protein GCM10027280_41060 [Micromonospora polyrhachis]|uniref:DUF3558 domain-containing protein n=1 Tax=Micromonospora polyrhachis TaxID=1282883 RepID=A0A7W7SNG6_9ACTN|nr:hypothetical protein [Micromonospora polyrhachis]MBB4956805.1 hypothetical protein [Micromonospora polyrhachis]